MFNVRKIEIDNRKKNSLFDMTTIKPRGDNKQPLSQDRPNKPGNYLPAYGEADND